MRFDQKVWTEENHPFYTNNFYYSEYLRKRLAYNVNFREQHQNDGFIRAVYNRLHGKDYDLFGIVVGDRGSGKSRTAISLAHFCDVNEDYNPRFFLYCDSKGKPHPLNRVVYKINDFLRLTTQVSPALPTGSFTVWDEAAIEGDSKNFASMKCKIIDYVFQTMRYKNYATILTTPNLGNMLIGARRLVQLIIKMDKRTRDVAASRPYMVERNFMSGDMYPFAPNIKETDNSSFKLKKYYFRKPAPYLDKYYDKTKQYVTQRWYKEFYDSEVSAMKDFIKENKIVTDEDGNVVGKADQEELTVDNVLDHLNEHAPDYLIKNKLDKDLLSHGLKKDNDKIVKLETLRTAMKIFSKKRL